MSEIIKKEDGKITITFNSSAEELNKALDKAFKKVVKRINVHGFRKGKLPRNVFNKMYGEESLYQEAVDSILPEGYKKAVEELKINPLAMPDVDVRKIDKKDGVEFEAQIVVRPEVKLGEYKNLGIKKEKVKVTDKDVDERIKQILSRQAEWTLKETASEKGDIVVIDFKGYKDGEPFEGGEANGYELELGSNSFIPGFEDQLVGKVAPCDVEVNVVFPENYQVKNLAGQKAKFDVKIHDVKTKEVPELTDELVKDLTKELTDNVADYKVKLKDQITLEEKEKADKKYADDVVIKSVENATVNIPEKLIEQEVDGMYNKFKENMQRQGITMELYEQFTGKKEKELKDEMKEQASKKIKTSFVLDEISKIEKIEVSEEDAKKEIKKIADSYSMSEEDVKKNLGTNFDIKSEIIIKKTIDLLKESNK